MNQQEIDRKRRIAEMLQQQRAPQAQMVGRFYVPPSGGSQIAAGLANIAGGYAGRKADDEQASFDTDRKAKMAEALRQMSANPEDPGTAAALAGLQQGTPEQMQQAVTSMAGSRLQPRTEWKDVGDALVQVDERGNELQRVPKGVSPDTQVGADTTIRGQDMTAETTRRGQDLSADTTTRGQDVTMRGQDVTAETARRGQDIDAAAETSQDGKMQAWDSYMTARKGLTEAMANTSTGYLAGKLPAMTANQQVADGAVSAMAPILKQIFRQAGEGVFTDKDQAMLLNMISTREDEPEAFEKKMELVDMIVSSKLGIQPDGQGQATQTPGAPEIGAVVENYVFLGGDPADQNNWRPQ